jgi:two-component system, chemotaxis family, response regulator Rcp1
MNQRRELEVLLVEDDAGDVELTRCALRKSRFQVILSTVDNGEKALAYLTRQAPYGDATRPDLILLDLNLPRMDGREVLKELKEDDELRSIPVVILTTSDADSDVRQAYRLGANCYVTKPVNLTRFNEVAELIETFWFQVVQLPERKRDGR